MDFKLQKHPGSASELAAGREYGLSEIKSYRDALAGLEERTQAEAGAPIVSFSRLRDLLSGREKILNLINQTQLIVDQVFPLEPKGKSK